MADTRDDGTKTLIYGALACTLTYIGLVFGIMGVVFARRQLRNGPARYTRAGYILSLVGIAIQLLMVVGAAVVIVLSRSGTLK
jgi:hypothetical protein